ncbi:MAG TPA: hypothetical protein VNM14_07035 [Planctomycetota bacterium]|jgi:hypothetical protein|nr:hypothetical protein [Planctomycetota bacterium]
MEFQRLEIRGRGGVPIGHVELMPAAPSEGEYKIVIQLQQGYQVLALRSDMCSGRISGIVGKLPLPSPQPSSKP